MRALPVTLRSEDTLSHHLDLDVWNMEGKKTQCYHTNRLYRKLCSQKDGERERESSKDNLEYHSHVSEVRSVLRNARNPLKAGR